VAQSSLLSGLGCGITPVPAMACPGQLVLSPRCLRALVVAVAVPALARPLSLPQAILDRVNGVCA
jgi:hypothetical protein